MSRKAIIPTRYKEDMTEVELRYYMTLLNDAVFKNGVHFTNHAEDRMKSRKLSKGKIQYVVREGDLYGVQFSPETQDIKFLISYATKGQYRKKFTTYASYSMMTGKVLSVWNRTFEFEEMLNEERGQGKSYFKNNNTIELTKEYIDLYEGEDFINFIRKYDKSPFSLRTTKKIMNYLKGITPIFQL